MSQSGRDGREAVQVLMDLARLGNLEGLLDLVPDSVVEKALERKQQMRYGTLICIFLGIDNVADTFI